MLIFLGFVFFSVLDGVVFVYMLCVASQNICYFGCTRNDHCNVIMKNFSLPNFERTYTHAVCIYIHMFHPRNAFCSIHNAS